jgi:hypothetical protein
MVNLDPDTARPGARSDEGGRSCKPEHRGNLQRGHSHRSTGGRTDQALRDNLQPFADGVYVNQLGETSDELVRAAYRSNYARLVEMKKKYDPKNVLSLNQNIKPDTPSNS